MRSISIVLLLCGCAAGPAPIMAPLIQKVEVPIAVPCKVSVPVVPSFVFNDLNIEQDIYEKVRALLIDRKLHMAYETELLASLKSCQ